MKNRKLHFPLYWLILLVIIFAILTFVPMMVGTVLGVFFNSEERRTTFHYFHNLFPVLVPLFGSLFVSIFIAVVLWRRVLLPLAAISQAAKQVAKGDFSPQIPRCQSLRELNELTDNFNRMVQELGSIESLRNDFVTNISHEFKTPLAAIEGYATLLQDPNLSEEGRQEYTGIIIDSTRQLTSMTGNILLLSRLEKQEIVTNQRTFKLDEQIRQAILMLEPIWEQKHLDLDISLASVQYYGNGELLLHVWMNLLQNAIKFTPSGGLLSVSMRETASHVEVSVADTGIGMDEATKKRIFEKFYTGSPAPQQKGNGLGLSITKRIVDLMDGTIQVVSAPEEGSCFTVRLPKKHPRQT